MYAQLHTDYTYNITPMALYKGHAFVVHDNKAPIYKCEFHNEWFAMPIDNNTQLHRIDKEEVQDLPGKEHNRLFEYRTDTGHIMMYRGNNVHDRWIAYAANATKYAMNLNNQIVDGIYDGINCVTIPNEQQPNPLETCKSPTRHPKHPNRQNILERARELKAAIETAMAFKSTCVILSSELDEENKAILEKNGFTVTKELIAWW